MQILTQAELKDVAGAGLDIGIWNGGPLHGPLGGQVIVESSPSGGLDIETWVP
ncbi:hypothetical protein [Herbaspirillum autotrophicum]|uniref:hypothetical protein n=1 Tax=Herbaspirillum autotrophicum TaxID=180195 RepID=UPI000A3FDC6E|nr:hypothetical protein [Herbaspirillum autotrophicum]